MKNKALSVFLGLLALLVLVVIGGSFYMLSYSLKPENNRGRDYDGVYQRLFADYPETKPWIDSLRTNLALRDTFVVMASGERHHALLIPAAKETEKTAVLVHGYTDCAVSMLQLGCFYHRILGFNLLLPDLHGHGKSEGNEAQMGWKERKDVLRWIALADSIYRDSTGKASIVVHGISMGAATTMGVAGEETPASVRAFVEDCGYTSVWDEFKAQLKDQFGLPEFPMMYSASMLCKVRYGWSFGEASPLEQVKKCRKPMLFIHGDNDSYVPTPMVYELYNAKPGRKELYIARGSAHAKSYFDHKTEYQNRLKAFLKDI